MCRWFNCPILERNDQGWKREYLSIIWVPQRFSKASCWHLICAVPPGLGFRTPIWSGWHYYRVARARIEQKKNMARRNISILENTWNKKQTGV
jgi:hypothetical protein